MQRHIRQNLSPRSRGSWAYVALASSLMLLLVACGDGQTATEGDGDLATAPATDEGSPDATDQTSEPGGEPIKIGLAASLSGTSEAAGTLLLGGYETWAEMVNREGGLLGRPVELVVYDDASDPTTAVRAFERLINEDEVDLTFGPYGSTSTFAVSQVTEPAGIPLLATAAGAGNIWEQGYEYVFQGEPGETFLADPPLRLASELGLSDVAVLYPDNDWGSGFFEASQDAAPEIGVEIVASEAYPREATDLSSAVLTAQRAEAEVITSAAYLADSELITRGLKAADWTPELVYLGTARQAEFAQDLGADAEGITSYAFWHPDLETPQNQEFQDLFEELKGREPSDHAALGFAAGQIYQAAVESVGEIDPEAIRDFLADEQVPTILAGVYGVDDTGLQQDMEVLVVQWQEGDLVIVYPDEYATHDLITPLPSWNDRQAASE